MGSSDNDRGGELGARQPGFRLLSTGGSRSSPENTHSLHSWSSSTISQAYACGKADHGHRAFLAIDHGHSGLQLGFP